jgi:hypothetical protein
MITTGTLLAITHIGVDADVVARLCMTCTLAALVAAVWRGCCIPWLCNPSCSR